MTKLRILIRYGLVLALLGIALPAHAQQITQNLSSASCPGTAPNFGCVVLGVTGVGTSAVQVTGTWSGTLTFEGSNDGVNFSSPTSPAWPATTTTSNGIWQLGVSGMIQLRVRFSSYSSGIARVVIASAFGGGGASGGSTAGSTFGAAAPSTGTMIAATDGTNAQPFKVDGSGNLLVAVTGAGSGGTSSVDRAAFTAGTSAGTATIGAFNDGLAALTSGMQGIVRVTASRAEHVNLRDSSGNEIGLSGQPLQVSLANTATNATAVKVDGSAVTQPVSIASLPSGAVTNAGTFAVQAAESGTWNITNVSGTVSLPTGASTSAKQPALGTAGAASADVLTVQGVASMTALASNITQLAGNAVAVGNGTTSSTGSLRVTIASDSTGTINTKTQDGAGNALTSLSVGAQRAVTVAIVDASGNQVTAFGGSGGTASNVGSAIPTTATTVMGYDGTNAQVPRVVDADTSGGTFFVLATNLVKRTSGTPTELIGQAAMAASLPVTIASDQSALAVSQNGTWNVGTVTAVTGITNALPAGTNVIGHVINDASSAVIGHVIADTGSTTVVTGNVTAVGAAASGGSKSGNPVQVGGVFNTTQPTVTTGQMVEAQYTARGGAIVATGADTFNVTVNAALPAGTNVIGHVIADTGSTTAVTGTVAVTESGTWTVQPGNTANTTAWLVGGGKTNNNATPGATNVGALVAVANAAAQTWTETNQVLLSTDLHGSERVTLLDSSGNAITPSTDGTQNTAAATTGPQVMGYASAATPGAVGADGRSQEFWLDTVGRLHTSTEGAQGSTTSGQLGVLMQGAVTTSSPSYTTAQTSPLSLDTSGSLRVNVVSGSTGNAAAGNTGSAVPTQADYSGVNVGGTLRGQTGANPSGTIYAGQVDLASVAGTTADTNSGTKSAGTLRVVIATDQPQLTNKLLVTPDANSAVNIAQMNGVATTMGNGVTGTGVQRVTISSDSTGQVTLAAGVATIGSLAANQSINEAQINGITPAMGNGVTNTGTQRVSLSSDSTGQVALAAGSATIGALTADQSVNFDQLHGTTVSVNNGAVDNGTLRVSLANNSTGQVNLTPNATADGVSLVPYVSQTAAHSQTVTLQSAAVANGNGTVLPTLGESVAMITVNCASCSGGTQVNFELTEDGTNYIAVNAFNVNTGVTATSITTNGFTWWSVPVAGSQSIRARVSSYSAGTITITGHAVPVAYSSNYANSNVLTLPATPAGTNLIGKVGVDQTTPGTTNAVAPVAINSAGTYVNDIVCDKAVFYDASTSGSTQLVAISGSTHVYVCGYEMFAAGTVNLSLTAGTGTACASAASGANNVGTSGAAAKLTPAWQFTAQTGKISALPTHGYLFDAGSANALCINTSAGVAAQAEVFYAQR
jgi:adhesin/invasin